MFGLNLRSKSVLLKPNFVEYIAGVARPGFYLATTVPIENSDRQLVFRLVPCAVAVD
jgi:hypothetical protein